MDIGANAYRRFLAGDDKGFEELVKIYQADLTYYLCSIVSDIHTAEDLCADTFFRLLVKKPKYDERCSFKSFLYAIGRNLALDELRRRKRHPIGSIEDTDMISDPADTPEYAFLKKESDAELYRAMRSLRPDYHTALYLIYFEGFDMEQTARVLGKSKHQTETLVWRAKRELKDRLKKEDIF